MAASPVSVVNSHVGLAAGMTKGANRSAPQTASWAVAMEAEKKFLGGISSTTLFAMV
jgi:hypothetical protein